MPEETTGWADLAELTAAQSSANTQLFVHDGDEAGDPKEKYMTRAEARIMFLQALQYFAALTPAANKLPYFTGTTSAALADLTGPGRDMIAAASAAAQLALLSGAPLNSPALTGTPTTTTAAGSDNSTRIASTAQVQAAIALAVTGVLELKGNTDCSGNPNYPAGVVGDLYYVSVAGKIGGASGKSVDVSDAIVCKTDNAGGTEASVGTSWFVLEHNVAGALLAANNLSDVANAGTARTNIGAHNADNLTAGTLANARLSADVLLRTLAAAKGDIIVAGANDSFQVLPVGADGKVLVARAIESLGMAWETAPGDVDWGLAALLAPTGNGGNDTTGTIGDFSKPYETAQAAFDAGAKVLVLLPSSVDYGAISSSGSAINLAIFSYGYNGGPSQIGAITSGGGAITIVGLTPRSTLRIASVSSSNPTASQPGGAIALTGVGVQNDITSDGTVANPGTGAAGGAAGSMTLTDVAAYANTYARGGNGGSAGNTLTGGTGGAGASISAINCQFSTIATSGGHAGPGGSCDTDLNIAGGDGGAAGAGGNVDLNNCTAGNVTTGGSIAGNGGSGDFALSISDGNGGTGGNGGSFTAINTTITGDVNVSGGSGGAYGGANSGNGGVGGASGNATLSRNCYCSSSVTALGGGGGVGSGGNNSNGSDGSFSISFGEVVGSASVGSAGVKASYVNGTWTA